MRSSPPCVPATRIARRRAFDLAAQRLVPGQHPHAVALERACARAPDTSSSSRVSRRGAISTCVTCEPRRAKACASSQPIGPPPSTTRRARQLAQAPQRVAGQAADLGQARAAAARTARRRRRARSRASSGGCAGPSGARDLDRPRIDDARAARAHVDAEPGVALDRIVRLDLAHDPRARAPSRRRSRCAASACAMP